MSDEAPTFSSIEEGGDRDAALLATLSADIAHVEKAVEAIGEHLRPEVDPDGLIDADRVATLIDRWSARVSTRDRDGARAKARALLGVDSAKQPAAPEPEQQDAFAPDNPAITAQRDASLDAWLSERCRRDPQAVTGAGRLFEDYAEFCDANGERALPRNAFGQRLAARDFVAHRTKHERQWLGITLRVTGDEPGEPAKAGDADGDEPPSGDAPGRSFTAEGGEFGPRHPPPRTGRGRQRKGKRGERELVGEYRRAGFDAARTPNSGGLRWRGDLIGVRGVHIEAKRTETVDLWAGVKQAERDAPEDSIPALHFRRSGEPWRVVIRLDAFIELLQARDARAAEVDSGEGAE